MQYYFEHPQSFVSVIASSSCRRSCVGSYTSDLSASAFWNNVVIEISETYNWALQICNALQMITNPRFLGDSEFEQTFGPLKIGISKSYTLELSFCRSSETNSLRFTVLLLWVAGALTHRATFRVLSFERRSQMLDLVSKKSSQLSISRIPCLLG